MTVQPDKLKTIFTSALERRSPSDREAYLDEACAGNPDLRAQVEALLKAHDLAGSFLEEPAVHPPQTTPLQPIAEKPGTQIGPYKLLQKIGEGGFGVVYMAEQTAPVERRVALKIIKPGMDTDQVIARFEAEEQALAMMDHPNIAKVLNAGTTESGRPYFVMELVKGIPITKYCDEQHLTPKERLDLFIPVCQAVQHAHQKGIIHRDLKPSNVLIALYDDKPVPKVIDFGVAKATSQRLTEKTMFTHYGQVVGTLEYMSPEQANLNQFDIDTRSDIYSLGVLLYELLAGNTPFDRERLRSAAFDEMMRIIREEEPPKPSTRLSTSESLPSIAANRHIEPKKLSTLVRGELDWIVMKALEKDRTCRYETANGFADDIQRYLNDDAVVACPPSRAYRFRKFARRNKAAIATTSVVLAALLLGMVGTTWQAIRATQAERSAREEKRLTAKQRDRAIKAEIEASSRLVAEQKARDESEAVLSFLIDDLFAAADWSQRPGKPVLVTDVLRRAGAKIDAAFPDQPLVEARLRYVIAQIGGSLKAWDKAAVHASRALQLYERELGFESKDALAACYLLYDLEAAQGKQAGAEGHWKRLEQHYRKHDPASVRLDSLLLDRAFYLAGRGDYPASLALTREAMTRHANRALTDQQRADFQYSVQRCLAYALVRSGQLEEAEKCLLKALNLARGETPQSVFTKSALGGLYERQGRLTEALEYFQRALEEARTIAGPTHPEMLELGGYFAALLARQGRVTEAMQHERDSLAAVLKVGQAEEAAKICIRLTDLARDSRRDEEAIDYGRQAVALIRRMQDSEAQRRNLVGPLSGLIWDLLRQSGCPREYYEEASELLAEYEEIAPENPGQLISLGVLKYRVGDYESAIRALQRSLKMRIGSVDISAFKQGHGQRGITRPGAAGFSWHRVKLVIDADRGTDCDPLFVWYLNDLEIARASATDADSMVGGHVSIGYMDRFPSIACDPRFNFGLIDNLKISGERTFKDDFDADSSADYVMTRSSEDTRVTFAFDYSVLGIPPAPHSPDGSTLGLKLEVNVGEPVGPEAITLHTKETSSGDLVVEFDAWLNFVGPCPEGGKGCTEFLTAGVVGDGKTTNFADPSSLRGSGSWVAFVGDGGTNRPYRMYRRQREIMPREGQFGAGVWAGNTTHPYYAGWGTRCYEWLFLAMAYKQLGEDQQALDYLTKAEQYLEKYPEESQELQLLEEARELVGENLRHTRREPEDARTASPCGSAD